MVARTVNGALAWPSFHDSEVLSMRLDRGTGHPSLEVDIHVHQMTNDLDERGCFVQRHHTLTTLRFDDIRKFEISDFNAQNAIDDIQITRSNDREFPYIVDWIGLNGCGTHLECKSVTVVDAGPWRERGDSP
jgi:immunity protein 50 of polymorphic toxin system